MKTGRYIHKYDDRYGPEVGGFRYKKWRPPEPLAVTILKLVGIGVAFTAASLLSPTFLLKAIKTYLKYKLDEAEYEAHLEKKRIQRSLQYLRRKKFVAYPAKVGRGNVSGKAKLTKSGRQRLIEIELEEIKIKPGPWDGQWRFLTFDIPEEKEGARNIFRRRLKELGFYHFQRSVFLLPYPCETEIEKMKTILEIESCVHLITAGRFESDQDLVRYFHLKS